MKKSDSFREFLVSQTARHYAVLGNDYDFDEVFRATVEDIGSRTRVLRGLIDHPDLFMEIIHRAEGEYSYQALRGDILSQSGASK